MATQGSSGGGLFSTLLILFLLAAAVALYLLALQQGVGLFQDPPVGQASIRVIEGAATSIAAPARVEPSPVAPIGQPLADLPEDQMALIRRVFAPETSSE